MDHGILSDCLLFVSVVVGEFSSPAPLTCGGLQASILSPLLFSIHISPLVKLSVSTILISTVMKTVHYYMSHLLEVTQASFYISWQNFLQVNDASLITLLCILCQYQVGCPFAFRTVLILCRLDSTRYWKYSSEISVNVYMTLSCSCSRFVDWTSMMAMSLPTTSQSCSMGLRCGDCKGHLSTLKSLSCSISRSCFVTWHPAESSYLKTATWSP